MSDRVHCKDCRWWRKTNLWSKRAICSIRYPSLVIGKTTVQTVCPDCGARIEAEVVKIASYPAFTGLETDGTCYRFKLGHDWPTEPFKDSDEWALLPPPGFFESMEIVEMPYRYQERIAVIPFVDGQGIDPRDTFNAAQFALPEEQKYPGRFRVFCPHHEPEEGETLEQFEVPIVLTDPPPGEPQELPDWLGPPAIEYEARRK